MVKMKFHTFKKGSEEETSRELLFKQANPQHCWSKTVEPRHELNSGFSVNVVEKLNVGEKPRLELYGGYGLTEKVPVAKTLSFLNNAPRRMTSKETNCP